MIGAGGGVRADGGVYGLCIVLGAMGGVDDDADRNASQSDTADDCAPRGCIVDDAVGWGDTRLPEVAEVGEVNSISDNKSRSDMAAFWDRDWKAGLPEEDLGVCCPRGGGANGAGRGVGLELSMDSKLAISSVRPPSIIRRSPTPRSGVLEAEIEGTSERKEKSSWDNSRSLTASGSIECVRDEGFRESLLKKRETADGPA